MGLLDFAKDVGRPDACLIKGVVKWRADDRRITTDGYVRAEIIKASGFLRAQLVKFRALS